MVVLLLLRLSWPRKFLNAPAFDSRTMLMEPEVASFLQRALSYLRTEMSCALTESRSTNHLWRSQSVVRITTYASTIRSPWVGVEGGYSEKSTTKVRRRMTR